RDAIARSRDGLMAAAISQPDPESATAVLVQAIEHREPEAAAHARRVSDMARALARAIGLDAAETTDVARGALLHDVGKVLLPDDLVRRRGPLADEQLALIRTHVELGADLVRAVPGLERAAAIVAASHEAWDGSGHPVGLVGEAIPVGARIVAIVDTFDTLTRERPDDTFTAIRAAAELVRCAGSRFDPAIVHAWLRLAESWRPVAGDPDAGSHPAPLHVTS